MADLDDTHKRVAGLYAGTDNFAAVWLSLNPDTGRVLLYDCCLWREREPIAVIADSLNARGRFIPIAHNSTELAEQLLHERGCNMLPEQESEDDAMAEVSARELQSKMRARLFQISRHCAEWKVEFETYNTKSSRIPKTGFPLMSATRFAISNLQFARAQVQMRARDRANRKPRTAIV